MDLNLVVLMGRQMHQPRVRNIGTDTRDWLVVTLLIRNEPHSGYAIVQAVQSHPSDELVAKLEQAYESGQKVWLTGRLDSGAAIGQRVHIEAVTVHHQ